MNIQTPGGSLSHEEMQHVLSNICEVFGCMIHDIEDIVPLQIGMTNIVLSFHLNGGKYIYRYPGLGSGILVDRGREAIVQKIVEDIGVDKTLVAMDVEEGWRISRFVEHRNFDYKNLNDMVRAMLVFRKLHSEECRVRWNFDVIKEAELIKEKIPNEYYGEFLNFEKIKSRIYELYELTSMDCIKKCNIHGDARDVNFLINDEDIYLIDWEYGGYGDPGFDIGSYICGGKHSKSDIDRILFIYNGKNMTLKQKRHFYAYIAIAGWFYMHWTMLKESYGQKVGYNKELWYTYARDYSIIALEMYKNDEKRGKIK